MMAVLFGEDELVEAGKAQAVGLIAVNDPHLALFLE
jgi:hypothetical protein